MMHVHGVIISKHNGGEKQLLYYL